MQANKKDMLNKISARMDVNHKMMAMLDGHHERTMASLANTKDTDLEANPEEIDSVT
jgi:hypothetical protein